VTLRNGRRLGNKQDGQNLPQYMADLSQLNSPERRCPTAARRAVALALFNYALGAENPEDEVRSLGFNEDASPT
jgi:hypothetical protein